jgi:hypothetical protein
LWPIVHPPGGSGLLDGLPQQTYVLVVNAIATAVTTGSGMTTTTAAIETPAEPLT